MKTVFLKTIIFSLLLFTITLTSACGSLEIGIENNSTNTDNQSNQESPTLQPSLAQAEETQQLSSPSQENNPDTASPSPDIQVVAWLGKVFSSNDGQSDDYLVFYPEHAGSVGLAGVDQSVEAEIQALHDSDKNANFWGTLKCGQEISDHNNCLLTVQRLRPDGPGDFFPPDTVDGWKGTITGLPAGSQVDDYFQLSGDFPIQFGIHGADENIQSQLENLRNSGDLVKLWGQITAGIPDAGSTQIMVNRIELPENFTLQAATASPIPQANGVSPQADWVLYQDDYFQFQFQYPPEAVITQITPQGFPTEELPQGMTADQYLQQIQQKWNSVCVLIEYDLGYIYLSMPPNEGFKYAICGRTGVGVGEIFEKQEIVNVNNQNFTAQGFEFSSGGKLLSEHNETYSFILPNDIRIEYGASPVDNNTYAAYLKSTKDILAGIMSTIQSTQ